MRAQRFQSWATGLGLACAVPALGALGGCGGEDDAGAPPLPLAQPQGEEERRVGDEDGRPPRAGGDERPEPAGPGFEVGEGEEAEVRRAVLAYVQALNAGDGEAICALLAPGAIDGLELPVERGSCADSLSASIGFRDPRGFPVFERSEVQRVEPVEIEGDRARATVTVTIRFRDRRQLTVEDDVVYLVKRDGRWQVAKPSSTLYRAIGVPDVPLDALAPPE